MSAVNGRNVTECLCESTKTRGEAQRGALFCTQVEGTGGARAIRTLDMIRFPIKKSSSYSMAVRGADAKTCAVICTKYREAWRNTKCYGKGKKLFGCLDVAQAGETTSLANFSSCLIYELKPLLLPYLYSRSLWIRAQPKGWSASCKSSCQMLSEQQPAGWTRASAGPSLCGPTAWLAA